MYTTTDFKTKKAMKAAVKAGDEVQVYQPGGFASKTDGVVALEGPHYPAAHTWYASVKITDGVVVRVLS